MEPMDVDLLGIGPQDVRTAPGADLGLAGLHPASARADRSRDTHTWIACGAGPRRGDRPGQLDQAVDRYRAVDLQRQHREDEPLPARPEGDRSTGPVRRHEPESPDVHDPSSAL